MTRGFAARCAERLRLSVVGVTHRPHSRCRKAQPSGGANEKREEYIGRERRSLSAQPRGKAPETPRFVSNLDSMGLNPPLHRANRLLHQPGTRRFRKICGVNGIINGSIVRTAEPGPGHGSRARMQVFRLLLRRQRY